MSGSKLKFKAGDLVKLNSRLSLTELDGVFYENLHPAGTLMRVTSVYRAYANDTLLYCCSPLRGTKAHWWPESLLEPVSDEEATLALLADLGTLT
jgi:hypothetical protein